MVRLIFGSFKHTLVRREALCQTSLVPLRKKKSFMCGEAIKWLKEVSRWRWLTNTFGSVSSQPERKVEWGVAKAKRKDGQAVPLQWPQQ